MTFRASQVCLRIAIEDKYWTALSEEIPREFWGSTGALDGIAIVVRCLTTH